MWKSNQNLKKHKEVYTASSVDLSTSALFQASFKQPTQDMFLLDSVAASPLLSPRVFHSIAFENNPSVENFQFQ